MTRLGPIYVITDTDSSWSVRDQVNLAAQGGAHLIQYRDKHGSGQEYYTMALQLLKDLKGYDSYLILNDRIQVAKQLPACGLHIGQSDGEIEKVRAQLAPSQLLGLSIEHHSQVTPSANRYADYFGIGPVRATKTKPDHAKPIGFDGLRAAVNLSTVHTYGIGGLSVANLPALKNAGANGIAVVSTVTRSRDPLQAVESLATEWSKS